MPCTACRPQNFFLEEPNGQYLRIKWWGRYVQTDAYGRDVGDQTHYSLHLENRPSWMPGGSVVQPQGRG